MNHVKSESNHGRRALLAGSAALLAGGAAFVGIGGSPAVADADAELLALCARAESLYRRFHDFYAGGAHPIADDDEREAAMDPLYEEAEQISQQIFATPAKTLAAHQARARALLAWHGDFDEFANSVLGYGTDGRIVAALIRDLAGEFSL